jgi:sugar phosphate isomerase/epimerase
MKLSIFTVLYKNKPLNTVLDIFKNKDIAHIEVGAGGFIGKEHCNPSILLENKSERQKFCNLFKKREMEISSLSCHGNPVHPQEHLAQKYHQDIKDAIDLAAVLGVERIVTFSGCPGDCDNSMYPNWPVSPFPEDFQKVVEWQWEKKLVPYWKKMGKYAEDKGVKIAMEMHGGYSVHSPYTAIKMRKETGCDSLGANLDPSHLWWQGIDPAQAAQYLCKERCLFFFHAKDAMINPDYVSYYGVTDMQSFEVAFSRGWQFRTVGFGHDLKEWANIFSVLRANGYDGIISIEHEDSYMSVEEGLDKAIFNLNQAMIFQPASTPEAFVIDKRFE